jgi:predicted RNase H-like HicB family nuclease
MKTKTHREHEEIITTTGRDFRCLFRREIDGYRVTCTDVPEMTAFGDTLDEARANARSEIGELIEAETRVRAWISAVQPEWW